MLRVYFFNLERECQKCKTKEKSTCNLCTICYNLWSYISVPEINQHEKKLLREVSYFFNCSIIENGLEWYNKNKIKIYKKMKKENQLRWNLNKKEIIDYKNKIESW